MAVGRGDVDRVRLHPHPFSSFQDAHRGNSAQEVGQQTGAARGLMSYNDKGHAAVGRHMPEKLLERLQTASRGADADNEISRRLRWGVKMLCTALAPLGWCIIWPVLRDIVPVSYTPPRNKSTCDTSFP